MLHPTVESGFKGGQLERRRTRRVCFCTFLGFIILASAGLVFLNETYRHEMRQTVKDVQTAMTERDSACLSSIHVGHDDIKMIVLAPSDNDLGLVMLNPVVYQTFGNEIKTQENANQPVQCYSGRKKTYTIHRTRYESITIIYTSLNTTDVLWPLKSVLMKRTTRTFKDVRSFCLQHCLELLHQTNFCEELVDKDKRYDKRIELR